MSSVILVVSRIHDVAMIYVGKYKQFGALAKSSVRQLVKKLEGSGVVRRESDGEIGEGIQP